MTTPELFLFVSHVSEDRAAAMEVVEELERRGVRCWIAPRDLPAGSRFDDQIADAIESAAAMLLIFSDRCNDSDYISREVTVAGESQKVIIPFRIENAQPKRGLRVRLSDLHWIDGFASRERALDQLVKTFHDPSGAAAREGGADKAPRQPASPVTGRRVDERKSAGATALPLSRYALVAGSLVGAVVLGVALLWLISRPTPKTVTQGLAVPAMTPKSSFKECDKCPEMVVVPAGSFTMGSPESERVPIAAAWATYGITPGALTTALPLSSEGPQHKVTIAQPIAVGRFPVTFDQWDACVDDGGCNGYRPSDQGWGRGSRPAINVNWDDAKAYAAWLPRKTGKNYRLLSEAEWEYMARAGTTTPFWWGSSVATSQANYNGTRTYGGAPTGENRQTTLPVEWFSPNPWGFYQVAGNSYDWVEDCIHDDYTGAPVDGSAWLAENCKGHVVRGGAWTSAPWNLRSAFRGWFPANFRSSNHGFRLARTVTP